MKPSFRRLHRWFFVCAVLASTLHAESETYQNTAGVTLPAQRVFRPWVFVGTDLGVASLTTEIPGEENKTGLATGFHSLLSYNVADRLILDAGLGLAYKRVTGVRPDGFQAYLETSSLEARISTRVQFAGFQFGPLLELHGLADLSHRPTVEPIVTNEPERGSMLIAGLSAVYEFVRNDMPIRAGVELKTDLDIPNRRLIEAQAVVQVGFPVLSSTPKVRRIASVRKKDLPTIENAASLEALSSPESVPIERAYFEIPLMRILFVTDSHKLAKQSKHKLLELGRFLLANRDKYTRLQIDGHADRVGNRQYNLDLSQRRAESVFDQLTRSGLDRNVLASRGWGYEKPFVKSANLEQALNRRVVIRVYGVSEPEFIDRLRSLTR